MDEQTDAPGPIFAWSSGAFRLGTIFFGLFAIVAVFAVIDRQRTTTVEQFEELSAVGDTVFFQRSTLAQGASPVVATLEGVPLYAANDQKKELKDTNMLRVARDETSGLAIYTPRRTGSRGTGKKEQTTYFVKLGRNDYLEVRPRCAGK